MIGSLQDTKKIRLVWYFPNVIFGRYVLFWSLYAVYGLIGRIQNNPSKKVLLRNRRVRPCLPSNASASWNYQDARIKTGRFSPTALYHTYASATNAEQGEIQKNIKNGKVQDQEKAAQKNSITPFKNDKKQKDLWRRVPSLRILL